jgi:ubiquinone/menaquinone biosynthesis C-methylase UbiE
MVKQAHPEVEVIGLDGDLKVLAIARTKAAKADVDLLFEQGMSYQMPYQENSFDCVLSSMMLHHLTTDNKKRTLLEAFRVLRPGGELHVVDFGPPRTFYSRLVGFVTARSEQAAINVKGLLPEMFREAGFKQVEETSHFLTVAGALSFYRARKS